MFSVEAIVWLVLSVVFVAVELIANAYILPLAIAAGAALVASLFGAVLIVQIIVFAIVVVLAYVFFKPNKQQKISKRVQHKIENSDYMDDISNDMK